MKRWILLASLAACQLSSAAPTTWQFTFEGLTPVGNPEVPFTSFTGTFAGEDRNRDGTLLIDELTNLAWSGFQVYPIIPISVPGQPEPIFSRLDHFRYAGPSLLEINGASGSLGPFDFYTVDTGDRITWDNRRFRSESLFGPDTTVRVTPVPEPATWGLMAVGLVGVGAVVKRVRRKDESERTHPCTRAG